MMFYTHIPIAQKYKTERIQVWGLLVLIHGPIGMSGKLLIQLQFP